MIAAETTKAELLAERCAATHEAIRAGRTALKPVGVQPDPLGEEPDLILYNCPHCGSTIARSAS